MINHFDTKYYRQVTAFSGSVSASILDAAMDEIDRLSEELRLLKNGMFKIHDAYREAIKLAGAEDGSKK